MSRDTTRCMLCTRSQRKSRECRKRWKEGKRPAASKLLVLSFGFICKVVRHRSFFNSFFVLINSGKDTCSSCSATASAWTGRSGWSSRGGLESSVKAALNSVGLAASSRGGGGWLRLLAGTQLNDIAWLRGFLVKKNDNSSSGL